MDLSFLAVVAISLCLISAMISVRMWSSGASVRKIAASIIHVWLAITAWIVLFRWLASMIDARTEAGVRSDPAGMILRLAHLEGGTRVWAVVVVGLSVAILAHLLWSMQRAMRGRTGS